MDTENNEKSTGLSKIAFYTIDKSEKEAVFQDISNRTAMPAFAVEKDWWVSRTLAIIFAMDISKHLVFKGGTSLSKAWKAINRFSEDIDLAIDKEFFLTSQKGWSKKEITALRKTAGLYSTGIFFEDLQKMFQENGFHDLKFEVIDTGESDQDPRLIEIFYPNIISSPSEYVLPRVQIEIGCRSLREPYALKTFGSLVDEYYAGRDFAEPLFQVPTVLQERTFLEKLFLLHEEFQRTAEKIRVDRLSRHLYDVYHLAKAGIADKAINDKQLYETIVEHRHKFARVGGVNYNQHTPKFLNPVPNPEVINAWKADYEKMLEDMIYDEEPPNFNQLIENLMDLKARLNKVTWVFELSFPTPKT